MISMTKEPVPAVVDELKDINFWSQDLKTQQQIADSIPKLQTWELSCYRDDTGYWYFDLPEYDIHAEAFIKGTQLVFDYWYQTLTGIQPTDGSKLTLEVSSEQTSAPHTCLQLVGPSHEMAGSHNYIDTLAKMPVWLCPMLVHMFGDAPATLYIVFHPLI